MLILEPHLCTEMDVWAPKYSTKFGETGEWCALIPVYKVDAASPVFIVRWTKAKHLQGVRQCIKRAKAQLFPVTNVKNKQGGITPMYTIPMSKLEPLETPEDIKNTINSFGW